MKFKKGSGGFKIKLKDKWYWLCACINCKEVHAFVDREGVCGLTYAMDKIKCCKEPDFWCESHGTDKPIKKFMKEWGDKIKCMS